MPSAGQLMRARKRFRSLLPDRATITRPTLVADGGGGQTTTWATVATLVPCRLSPVGGGEDVSVGRRGGDRVSDEASAVVTFGAGQDIGEKDRVTVGALVFDVTLVRLRGAYELTKRAECREV